MSDDLRQGNAPEVDQDYVPEDRSQESSSVSDLESEFFSEAQEETVSQEEQPSSQEDWEHKYKVIKGKYDKEVPRLHKELKQLKEDRDRLYARVTLLEQILASTQTASSAPKQSAKEDEDVDEDLKKVKEEYPELFNAVAKLIEKKISREVKPELDTIKTSTAKNSFLSRLSTLVPEWETLNTDPAFLSWLSERSVEIPTRTRHQLMLDAYNQGDAEAVAAFFRRYLEEQKQAEQVQASAPATKVTAPPHRKTMSSTKDTSGKKIFKESEIRDFYLKAAQGLIPPDKKKAMEEEIIRAMLEDRVLLGR